MYSTIRNDILYRIATHEGRVGCGQDVQRQSTRPTLPKYRLSLPLVETVVFVWIEDRGGFVTDLLCDILAGLGRGGFFLFSLVQVLDTPEGGLSLAVLDLAHIDAALAQDVAKLVEILQWRGSVSWVEGFPIQPATKVDRCSM